MSRILTFLFILGLLGQKGALHAQDINLPVDSVKTLLCKKWEIGYVLMGEMKIGRKPGASDMDYEFKKDMTLLLTGQKPGDKTTGTWAYDKSKKQIRLTINGRKPATIVSLKEGEFTMTVDTKKATPDDPTDIKIIYKTKTN